MREGTTKLLTRRDYALIVPNALLSELKKSSANDANFGLRQNAKISVIRSIRTFRKFNGSVPTVQNEVQQRIYRNKNNKGSMWMT